MFNVISKLCCSLIIALSVLANLTTFTNSSDLSLAPIPKGKHETSPPEVNSSFASHAPTPSPSSKIGDAVVLPPLEYSVPKPVGNNDAHLAAPLAATHPQPDANVVEASTDAGAQAPPDTQDVVQASPDVSLQEPRGADVGEDTGVAMPQHQNSVLPSNYSAEDEVNEFIRDQEASWATMKVQLVVGTMFGFFVVGLGALAYKKKEEKRRTYYHSLGKKEEI